jgi:hypothetical protein
MAIPLVQQVKQDIIKAPVNNERVAVSNNYRLLDRNIDKVDYIDVVQVTLGDK